jgi:hypothetical protein
MLSHAMAAGRVPIQPIEPLAHVLLGALRESALFLADARDHAQARREIGAVLDRLILSLVSVVDRNGDGHDCDVIDAGRGRRNQWSGDAIS